MKLDPRRLAILLSVHRDGGIVAAADSLGISASAVSQQIARLEKEAGVRAIERTPSGAVLTRAGRVLAESAERIEIEIADAGQSLLELQGHITGTVTVGAFQTITRSLLVPMVATLNDYLPGVELHIQELTERDGLRAMRSRTIDLLVMERDEEIASATPRGFRDIPLYDEPWLVVSPTSEPTPTSMADLANLSWLDVDEGTAAMRAHARIAAALGSRHEAKHRYTNYDVALAMVEAGLGTTLLPELALYPFAPESVKVTPLPGLGVRRLTVRHRVTRNEPGPATTAILQHMRTKADELKEELSSFRL